LTSIAAVAALLFTAQSLAYTADATRATRDELKLNERGQVTDRFGKAIDQLGQEDADGQSRLSIRLGGIYALERLMRDSESDAPTIIEVLCAFVRTHAAASATLGVAPPTAEAPPSPPDVQAAVVVLARRPNPDQHWRLDLTNTRLSMPAANLADADLRNAYLAGVDLNNADLGRANLGEADLTNADLNNADLRRANLTNAYLGGANLADAYLNGANLAGADLTNADLTEANLGEADLTNADLTDADLRNAYLIGADLTGANVTGEQVRCTWVDDTTKLPAGVTRPMEPTPRDDPECRNQ
jgi:hypothetical protein